MPFISFSYLIALARTSSITSKSIQSSTIKCVIAVFVFRMPFIRLSSIMFVVYWEFLKNGCWVLSNPFFVSVEIIICFFFFLLTWWIILVSFQMLNQLCISKINSIGSWCNILFIYCYCFVKIFCICVHKGYWISSLHFS